MNTPNALRRLWFRQNPHSLYVASAALFFTFTLVLDYFLFAPERENLVFWGLLAFCCALVASALALGDRFSVAAGLSCVTVFIIVSMLFMSPWGDVRSAVASAQELPILSLYLGWFVARPYGRCIMFVTLLTTVMGMAFNPIFQPGGVIGVAAAAQIIIIALLAFEVGSLLWRESERRLMTDSLTGVLNQRAFIDRLSKAVPKAQRTSLPLTVVAIDFDNFKHINDELGHATGDRVLAESAERWRLELRREDTIARIGGDEFGLIFPATHIERAEHIMQRLRASAPHDWSWGAAELQPSDTAHTLIERADAALYSMKRAVS